MSFKVNGVSRKALENGMFNTRMKKELVHLGLKLE